jgi:hypothetical protein
MTLSESGRGGMSLYESSQKKSQKESERSRWCVMAHCDHIANRQCIGVSFVTPTLLKNVNNAYLVVAETGSSPECESAEVLNKSNGHYSRRWADWSV